MMWRNAGALLLLLVLVGCGRAPMRARIITDEETPQRNPQGTTNAGRGVGEPEGNPARPFPGAPGFPLEQDAPVARTGRDIVAQDFPLALAGHPFPEAFAPQGHCTPATLGPGADAIAVTGCIIYYHVLGRFIDPEGLRSSAELFKRGIAVYRWVKAQTEGERVIRKLYPAILGREADAGSIPGWRNALAQGIPHVSALLARSEEGLVVNRRILEECLGGDSYRRSNRAGRNIVTAGGLARLAEECDLGNL